MFNVTSGPNTGTQGAGLTGANGQFAFTYTGMGPTGTDSIQASIGTLASNLVFHTWTSSPLTSGSACNGTFNGTINENVTVRSGQECVLIGGTVNGNISQTGGTLTISHLTVKGNLQVQNGGTVSVGPNALIQGNLQIQNVPASAAASQICRATVQGNVQVQNTGGAVQIGSASAGCAGNIISGNLQVQNNAGATGVVGNIVSGNLQDQNNTAPTQVTDNTVTNILQCENNTSITGGGNTASLKQGQCSAF